MLYHAQSFFWKIGFVACDLRSFYLIESFVLVATFPKNISLKPLIYAASKGDHT